MSKLFQNPFRGKNVLLTGASGSFGSTLQERLIALGATVHSPPRSIGTKQAIDHFLFQTWVDYDYVILNDGTNHLSWIGATPVEDVNIMRKNVMDPYWVLNGVVARQSARFQQDRPPHPARVLFVSSQTYRVAQRTTALYCASKAAMVQMMRVAARELAPEGWVVNAVAPGKIADTEMSELTDAQVLALRGWTQEEADGYAAKLIPAGRVSTRDEMADVILWTLCAPEYVNGTVIEAMGGV